MNEGISKTWLELPVSVKKKLVELCEKEGVTQKQWFINAIEQAYQKQK